MTLNLHNLQWQFSDRSEKIERSDMLKRVESSDNLKETTSAGIGSIGNGCRERCLMACWWLILELLMGHVICLKSIMSTFAWLGALGSLILMVSDCCFIKKEGPLVPLFIYLSPYYSVLKTNPFDTYRHQNKNLCAYYVL